MDNQSIVSGNIDKFLKETWAAKKAHALDMSKVNISILDDSVDFDLYSKQFGKIYADLLKQFSPQNGEFIIWVDLFNQANPIFLLTSQRLFLKKKKDVLYSSFPLKDIVSFKFKGWWSKYLKLTMPSGNFTYRTDQDFEETLSISIEKSRENPPWGNVVLNMPGESEANSVSLEVRCYTSSYQYSSLTLEQRQYKYYHYNHLLRPKNTVDHEFKDNYYLICQQCKGKIPVDVRQKAYKIFYKDEFQSDDGKILLKEIKRDYIINDFLLLLGDSLIFVVGWSLLYLFCWLFKVSALWPSAIIVVAFIVATIRCITDSIRSLNSERPILIPADNAKYSSHFRNKKSVYLIRSVEQKKDKALIVHEGGSNYSHYGDHEVIGNKLCIDADHYSNYDFLEFDKDYIGIKKNR